MFVLVWFVSLENSVGRERVDRALWGGTCGERTMSDYGSETVALALLAQL